MSQAIATDVTRWPVKVAPLPWYGGKQRGGKAEWIAGLLPWRKGSTYVEPFGGQMTILLRRSPVEIEIYNDLDGRIVNWWRMVRHERQELGRLIEGIPHSEKEFAWAKGKVDNSSASDLERASAFYILATQTIAQDMRNGGWKTHYHTSGGSRTISCARWKAKRVDALCERIWDVQLFCRPAERILERVSGIDDAVIYADPPYRTACTSNYAVCELDSDSLSKLFLVQSGHVAISGYNDEWDHLGWQRHELEVRMMASIQRGTPHPQRTEVLWTNYDVAEMLTATATDSGRLL